jgi:hypothetical protein
LVTVFNNNPNLLNLKNDYSIWGEREGISGIKIPVHLRYAIDKKPVRYRRIFVDNLANEPEVQKYNQKYNTNIGPQSSIEFSTNDYDWREIIY